MHHEMKDQMNGTRRRRSLKPSRRRLLLWLVPLWARADDWNKSTRVRFEEATLVGDILLQPGTYELRLTQSADRRLVQILKADTRQLITQIFAFSAFRLDLTAEPSITFREGGRGRVRSLRTWFYPGDHYGLEFPRGEQPAAPFPPLTPTPVPRPQALGHREVGASYPHKWLLSIGVNQSANKLFDLPVALNDAFDVANMFMNQRVGRFETDGTHVRILVNAETTRRVIEDQIRDIGGRAGPKDLVVVYISAHGVVEETTGLTYLATNDTSSTNLHATALELGAFVEYIGSNIAGQAVLIVDACDSGAATEIKKVLTFPAPHSFVPSAGRVTVIASSSPKESSWARPDNSYFTRVLLEAMEGTNGTASLDELFRRLKAFVTNAVDRTGHSQHPQIYVPPGAESIVLGAPTGE